MAKFKVGDIVFVKDPVGMDDHPIKNCVYAYPPHHCKSAAGAAGEVTAVDAQTGAVTILATSLNPRTNEQHTNTCVLSREDAADTLEIIKHCAPKLHICALTPDGQGECSCVATFAGKRDPLIDTTQEQYEAIQRFWPNRQ